MYSLLQQIASGIAMGGIYACLGLALVMIYQSTHHINFAQGEMAMFSTFIAFLLLKAGLPYWAAALATLAFGFVAGFLIERLLLRPLGDVPELSVIVVFIGLLIGINSLAGWVFGHNLEPFSSTFPDKAIGGLMVAPVVFLEPNMMGGVLIYAFAGALLGGIDNPWGAVAGGLIVGVVENLAGTYVVGTELKLTLALVLIVGVLLIRPSGI